MICQSLAEELGLQVGEVLVAKEQVDLKRQTQFDAAYVSLRVAGVWKAKDEAEDYWFYNPEALREQVILTETSYREALSEAMQGEVDVAHLVLCL